MEKQLEDKTQKKRYKVISSTALSDFNEQMSKYEDVIPESFQTASTNSRVIKYSIIVRIC